MTPEMALQRLEQLTTGGFCVLENILMDDFLEELRAETDRLLDSVDHSAKWKYQGSDLYVSGKENSVVEKLVNGCFQIISGTHRKGIPLHDELVIHHQETAYFADEDDQAMFAKHPDAVDVSVKAGSLVIGEGRTLHAAQGNQSAKRRTLLLGWHERPHDTIPSYWTGDVPEGLIDRDPDAEYPRSRVPGEYLVSE